MRSNVDGDFVRLGDGIVLGCFAVEPRLQMTEVSPELARELFDAEAADVKGDSVLTRLRGVDRGSLHANLQGAMRRSRCQFRLHACGGLKYELHTWASRIGMSALVRACRACMSPGMPPSSDASKTLS